MVKTCNGPSLGGTSRGLGPHILATIFWLYLISYYHLMLKRSVPATAVRIFLHVMTYD